MVYLLLGTEGCHLCEIAEELLAECRSVIADLSVKLIDIAEQTQWQQDFATLIPVLLHVESQQFLNWPFTQGDILTFIKHHND